MNQFSFVLLKFQRSYSEINSYFFRKSSRFQFNTKAQETNTRIYREEITFNESRIITFDSIIFIQLIVDLFYVITFSRFKKHSEDKLSKIQRYINCQIVVTSDCFIVTLTYW